MADELTEDEKTLLDAVASDGTPIGNKALRTKLGWNDEARYWKTRDALISAAKLTLGRGQGGSVRLNVKVLPSPPPDQLQPSGGTIPGTTKADESLLYEPVRKVLNDKWAKDLLLEEFFVEITAKQGRRDTGGTWTRPDVIVINVSTYQNLPGKYVDVTSFEIKTHENCDVTSVYEALAHLRAATRSYVLIAVPTHKLKDLEKLLEQIKEEAARHGVGLIVATDVSDYETWDFRVDAILKQPDISRLDEFIENQLDEDNRRKLRKWIK